MPQALPTQRQPHVVVRGGGDLASGVAWRLYRSGMAVSILELPHPMLIRRTVCFGTAVYQGEHTLEGITAYRTEITTPFNPDQGIALYLDPHGLTLKALRPDVLVDARMTKTANDTRIDDAPLVLGLGPGFTAGTTCHAAIETQRGHFLGRVYYTGSPLPDSGIPGTLGGESARRVIRAPRSGRFETVLQPGIQVAAGQFLGTVDGAEVRSTLTGLLRGLMFSGTPVLQNTKVADVDPRPVSDLDLDCISDKARAIGGAVLEAILWHQHQRRLLGQAAVLEG